MLSRGLDQTNLNAIATHITTIATYSALAVKNAPARFIILGAFCLRRDFHFGGMQIARPFYLAAQLVWLDVHLDIFCDD